MASFSKSIKQAADDAERLAGALRSIPQGGGGFAPALPSGPAGVVPQRVTFITNVQTIPTASAHQGGGGSGGGGSRTINGLPIQPYAGITSSAHQGGGGSGGGGRLLPVDVKGIAREIVRQLGVNDFSGNVIVRSSGGG